MKKTGKSHILKIILTSVIAAAVVYFLLSKLPSLSEIPKTLSNISKKALLIAFALYCLSLPFKALRFRLIMDVDIKLHRLVSIIALQAFFTNILPMRTGELSYVYLLKQKEEVSTTKSVASLMSASIIDILLILVLIFSTAWHFKGLLAEKLSYSLFFWLPLLLIFAILSVVAAPIFAPKACCRIVKKITIIGENIKVKLLSRLVEKFVELLRELTNISFDTRLAGIVIFSIANLGIRFAMQCYLVRAMQIDLGVLEIIFALSFTAFFNMFPIQSFGNFGAVEAPWTLALLQLQVSKDLAIISVFSLHLLTIFYCVILGVYGFASIRVEGQKGKRASPIV